VDDPVAWSRSPSWGVKMCENLKNCDFHKTIPDDGEWHMTCTGGRFDVILVQISHFLIVDGPLWRVGGGSGAVGGCCGFGDLSLAPPTLGVGKLSYGDFTESDRILECCWCTSREDPLFAF